MAKPIEPIAILLAETHVNHDGLGRVLAELGVSEWKPRVEDMHSDVSEAELLTEVAGKLCYLSFSTDLNKNLTRANTRTNREYIQTQIIGTKHGSVLEHSSVTFALMNVSRVFTHELVRHRAGAAYSQVSGRYARTDELDYYLPEDIANEPEAKYLFQRAFSQMEEWIRDLERITDIDNEMNFSVKKRLTSAFRRIIGNGQANHIIVTGNHRAWRHWIEMRTSAGAEEEIRKVFVQIFDILARRHPAIYGDAETEMDRGIPAIRFRASKV
jgi:thymidylate synthase (FAD)